MTLSEVTADGDRTTLSVMIRPADAAGFARLVKSPRRSHVLGAAPPPARTAQPAPAAKPSPAPGKPVVTAPIVERSEEHTSELQSLMRISYAVFCLTKTTLKQQITH